MPYLSYIYDRGSPICALKICKLIRIQKCLVQGWGCRSVVETLSSMCKVLGLIPSTENKTKQQQKGKYLSCVYMMLICKHTHTHTE